ncbi:MAG: hypothetical protein AAGH42_03095 [Pseudomonadota bacterium]
MDHLEENPPVTKPDVPFRFLTSGIDSLYVCYPFDIAASSLELDTLDYQKALLKDDPSRHVYPVALGGVHFGLLTNGAFPYRWVLANRKMTWKLARAMQPSVQVEFSSVGLWHEGANALHHQVQTIARAEKMVAVAPDGVSRVDYAFDYHIPYWDFSIANMVSRARKDSQYRAGETLQTLTFGRGDIVVRVYDKSAEIVEKSGKAWLHDIWGVKDHVWRIEFQWRREALKRFGIRTMADLQSGIGDALRDVASRHTTMRLPGGDSNKSRWPLHPLWQDLLQRIETLPARGVVRDYDQPSSLALREHEVMLSVMGHLKGLAALIALQGDKGGTADRPPDIEATIRRLQGFAIREVHPFAFEQAVQERIRKYEAGQW